jgi:hypothetical protein
MTDPIVEIHYIKPGSTKPLSPSIDIVKAQTLLSFQ